MTTANLLNVSPVKGVQVDVSKKLQEEAIEVTEIFASMMNQSFNPVEQMENETSSNIGVSKADGAQAINDSYERFSYKDKQIEAAKDNELSEEEVKAAQETLEQTEEEIITIIREEYDVDEEAIQDLLEKMGLEVIDLLDPKNLVSFMVALTDVASGEELLLDESFLTIMDAMNTIADNLMKELNVDMNGLQDIISQMEIMNAGTEEVTFEQELTMQMEGRMTEDGHSIENSTPEEVVSSEVQQSVEASEELNVQKAEVEDTTDTKVEPTRVNEASASAETESTLSSNEDSREDSLLNQQNDDSEVVILANQSSQQLGQVSKMPQTQFTSYFSVDTAQIMEQIAEQIKVVVTPDTTSMEMQLNPENLGKIYLNISSEKGTVNAQFYATNEVVKEALEAQMSILRENLTQAGVKVDAIEVTIASHEFEKNLEQNQQNPNEEQVQQEQTPKRRNITVDTLDELAGVMTEEETLVAQIMKDNGNSVDFTA